MMLGRHARYMPVLSERTLMGVISFYDVAKAVVDSQDFENRMLKAYIRDWPVESRDELPSSKPNLSPGAARARPLTHVRQHPRHALSRHQLRREPRPGDRLRHRRLPARHGAVARPTSSPSSIGAAPAPRATSRSATRPTRSRSCPACSRAGPPARRSCLLIRNTDQRSKDYGNLLDTFRPGHADYTYLHKYGLRDPRGGGRASARLTAPMVGAGAVARKWLREHTARRFVGHMTQIGEIAIPFESLEHVAAQPVLRRQRERHRRASRPTWTSCARPATAAARASTVVARDVPVGLGEPLFDKLDADIAHAMMGINAVKGVEIGAGFARSRSAARRTATS